jgi:hypothetical protein
VSACDRGQADLDCFAGRPLDSVGGAPLVGQAEVTAPISLAMPFDVGAHPAISGSPVAQAFLARLEQDLKSHQDRVNASRPWVLTGGMRGGLGDALPPLLGRCRVELTALRDRDLRFVQLASSVLVRGRAAHWLI